MATTFSSLHRIGHIAAVLNLHIQRSNIPHSICCKVKKKDPVHSATSVMLIIIPSTYTRPSGADCWVCVGAHKAELEGEARVVPCPRNDDISMLSAGGHILIKSWLDLLCVLLNYACHISPSDGNITLNAASHSRH